MEIRETLYVTNRKEWRSWLAKHYKTKKEIWIIYYKKHSGKQRIPYNDAVEEALCYGWIDSTAKRIDGARFAQRFSPRRQRSLLSIMNKERIKKLLKQKKMTAHGLKAVSHAFGRNKEDKFTIASDILKELKRNKDAWVNFQKFPESYKRIRIGYIESQRRHSNELYKKSLQNFIKMTAKNKKFGMVK